MKKIALMVLALVQILSCNTSSGNKEKEPGIESKVIKKEKFFPVTDYLKGQVYEIINKGFTPVKYTTRNGHTDSSWLKAEGLSETFKEFLHPEIDSTNLTGLFTEKKFLDQSINAITFSYDPSGTLPDSMNLRHWDVYIDPELGTVKRVYLVKSIGTDKILQLTWINDKWCKLTTIKDLPNGSSMVEMEEKINWDF